MRFPEILANLFARRGRAIRCSGLYKLGRKRRLKREWLAQAHYFPTRKAAKRAAKALFGRRAMCSFVGR